MVVLFLWAKRHSLLFSELAAGAESGWDYSSRWFARADAFDTIRTSRVVPVDLNAIMYDVEATLATFHTSVGDETNAVRKVSLLAVHLTRKLGKVPVGGELAHGRHPRCALERHGRLLARL